MAYHPASASRNSSFQIFLGSGTAKKVQWGDGGKALSLSDSEGVKYFTGPVQLWGIGEGGDDDVLFFGQDIARGRMREVVKKQKSASFNSASACASCGPRGRGEGSFKLFLKVCPVILPGLDEFNSYVCMNLLGGRADHYDTSNLDKTLFSDFSMVSIYLPTIVSYLFSNFYCTILSSMVRYSIVPYFFPSHFVFVPIPPQSLNELWDN